MKIKIKNNIPLSKISFMKVGGKAKFFISVKTENELKFAIKYCLENRKKWFIIGDGSNIIPNDKGVKGLVIQNKITKIVIKNRTVFASAGENLLKFISLINKHGLAGMEKMAGIPGTIGGAIYGNAGAYGQEIQNCIKKVQVYDAAHHSIRWLSKHNCQFDYRESIFKKRKELIILWAKFAFARNVPKILKNISKNIIALRQQKYPSGLACPGSFFKNIVFSKLPLHTQMFLKKCIKKSELSKWHGKLPAGYLLEKIGAKNFKSGGIRVAKHHANLIYNDGKGKSKDIAKLSAILKKKVKNKFGIILEEEVQFI